MASHPNGTATSGGTAIEVTPHKAWLLVVGSGRAVAVYTLMWIGFVLQWNWLTDHRLVRTGHAASLRRRAPQLGDVAWNVFCTVLGPTAFRLLALVVIIVALVGAICASPCSS